MEDVPQPADEPYQPGDCVRVYIGKDDLDSGGGGNPPEGEEQTIRTTEGLVAGAVDRSTEFEEDEQGFVYGDIVHDEEPEDLVVVNLPDTRADEWEMDDGNLADRHPACPVWDDVIIVVPLLCTDSSNPFSVWWC